MTCPARLEQLGCHQTGVGFLACPLSASATELVLQDGQGANFPTPQNGRVFYVDIDGCGCCTRLKVTGRVEDTLTVEPTGTCSCVKSNARIRYAHGSPEHMRLAAMEAMPTFVYPLVYDCETHTVSIDCEGLKDLVDMPCSGG